MANKHLRLEPHQKSGEPDWWWYEEPKGIRVVVAADEDISTRAVMIPWRSIRAALERKDRGDD